MVIGLPALNGRLATLRWPEAGPRLFPLDAPGPESSPLGLLAQSVPGLLFTSSADGQRVHLNREWLAYTGLADFTDLEREWEQLVPAEDRPALEQAMPETPQPGTLVETRFRLRHASGEYRWQLSRARWAAPSPSASGLWAGSVVEIERLRQVEEALDRRERELRSLLDKAPDGILRLDRELRLVEELLARERSAREEAEALAKAKDEFLAVVSHELRSPLNAIRGWAHVLRKSMQLTDGQAKPLDAIDRNVAAQARMVDDLLDTQRLLRGKITLEPRRTPLATLVEQALDTFRPAAREKQLQLTVRHAPDLPMIEADPERLRQVLVNLLSNAVKFTPAQGRVQVVTRRCSADRLAIDVQDTGVGLESGQAARVFEPFRQAGGFSSTRRQGGLGLGLTLARQLVELHGGLITVASPGLEQGTTFTVELPALPPDLAIESPPTSAGRPAPALAGRKVAVLDDDPEGRQILELLLRDEVAQAVFFGSAADGFDYLRGIAPSERPDVLISDIAMPGEDGYSFIRRVRDLHCERGEPRLPAVALTAFASPSDRARALAAGFDAHLGKPLDPEQLRATLKELLRETLALP